MIIPRERYVLVQSNNDENISNLPITNENFQTKTFHVNFKTM